MHSIGKSCLTAQIVPPNVTGAVSGRVYSRRADSHGYRDGRASIFAQGMACFHRAEKKRSRAVSLCLFGLLVRGCWEGCLGTGGKGELVIELDCLFMFSRLCGSCWLAVLALTREDGYHRLPTCISYLLGAVHAIARTLRAHACAYVTFMSFCSSVCDLAFYARPAAANDVNFSSSPCPPVTRTYTP